MSVYCGLLRAKESVAIPDCCKAHWVCHDHLTSDECCVHNDAFASNQPGLRYLFDPNGFLAALFPWRVRFVSPGRASLLLRKYQDFKENDCDIITSVSLRSVHDEGRDLIGHRLTSCPQ